MYKVHLEVLQDIKKLLENLVKFDKMSVKDQKEAERLLKLIEDNYHV